ncbi:MAG: hypothetical protein JW801_13595 [Bacteroidales bacterium]|nr:hypothetical protein [Bacteroidales bacterium]
MTNEVFVLVGSAALIGFTHTLFGPDHYIPFVFMARARKWAMRKTLWITLLCGLGHVLSSIAIGFGGLALGKGVSEVVNLEGMRGDWAAWGFAGFGFLYMLWGLYRAYKNKPHEHIHLHSSTVHEHEHVHENEHNHLHKQEEVTNITPWVLFVIFVLGPCEVLIPTFIYPAVKEHGSLSIAIFVSVVFAIVTLATMLVLVYFLVKGVNFIRLSKFERYTHAMAGAILLLSGLGILFMGL